MQEPQGHKLNRAPVEVKPSTELKQKISELMVLIESSQDSIALVEDEIKLAADEIRDRVCHFPKVFVDRFHQQLSESTTVLDVELAVRHLNQDLEKADAIYKSIPNLPLMAINWWREHPNSNAISIAAIAALITLILTIPGSFAGLRFTGGLESGNTPARDR